MFLQKKFLAVMLCIFFAGVITSPITHYLFKNGLKSTTMFGNMIRSSLRIHNRIPALFIPLILLSTFIFEIMVQYSELIIFFTIIGFYEFVSEFQLSLTETADSVEVSLYIQNYTKLIINTNKYMSKYHNMIG